MQKRWAVGEQLQSRFMCVCVFGSSSSSSSSSSRSSRSSSTDRVDAKMARRKRGWCLLETEEDEVTMRANKVERGRQR
jgi:hypothetical protein